MRALLLIALLTLPAVAASYGDLPLVFEPNMGQTDPQVRFLARAHGMTALITDTGAVMLVRGDVVRMQMLNARAARPAEGVERLPGISNYFIGSDPGKWRTNVPNYARVTLAGVYPGVDIVYHGNQRRLEYDFVVAPGANPGVIELAYEGASAVTAAPDGDLLLQTSTGTLRQEKPRVYQEVGGRRVAVAGGYKVQGRRVGFELARYDISRPVIIDPILEYSTALGGNGLDYGYAIAVDGLGSAYVTGTTASSTFSIKTPFQTRQSGQDVFVTKLNASGNGLVYSTYLGGSGDEIGYGIAVDATGSAYVTGATTSTNFPVQSPFQRTKHGFSDAFLVKLSGAGNTLVYSTYIGGAASQESHAVAVDGSGSAYIAGWTSSADYPALSPIQAWKGVEDAFVTKFTPAGTALVYSTVLGGGGNDFANGIAVDASGAAYVAGVTDSPDFPVQAPIQRLQGLQDAFVAKLSPSGNSLVYATYLGGMGNDQARGIAIDGQGSAYVAGWTTSSDFPTKLAYQSVYRGSDDSFVAKLAPAGNALVYSTYIGGTGEDVCNGIAVDLSGSAYITGWTSSTNFPLVSPTQSAPAAGNEVFITKLAPEGNALVYSTYLGGTLDDGGAGIAVDSLSAAYVVGWTASPGFPFLHPFQTYQAGGGDAFVAKIQGYYRPPRRRP